MSAADEDASSPSAPTRHVAIVGAGPAGISAARELIKAGFNVTMFDKEAASGGLKRYGYPSFRMPTSVSEREAAQLVGLGLEFRGGTELGENLNLADLEQEYAAVLLAIGAPVSRKLGIPGEELPGVYDALNYLYCSRIDKLLAIGDNVLVIGGGDTAVDAATTALFSGAKRATMLSRRASETELAAQSHEIKYAKDKGVEFKFNGTPVKIEAVVTEDGGSEGLNVTTAPAKGLADGTIEQFNNVIVAIGQDRNAAFIESLGLSVADDGSTDHPTVFVAGGALYGSQRLANAIIDGRRASFQIIDSLS